MQEEVLAQDRHVDGLPDPPEGFGRATEVLGFGEDRQRCGAALDHRLGEGDRVVPPFPVGRRGRRFDLGDERNPPLGRGGFERAGEVPGVDVDAPLDPTSLPGGGQDRLDGRGEFVSIVHYRSLMNRDVHKTCGTVGRSESFWAPHSSIIIR